MMEEKEVLEDLENIEEGEKKQVGLLERLKNYLEKFQGKQDNR
jgi:hypothetical protein